MSEVVLPIGGRPHPVACREGEEAQLRHLGQMLDERWAVAQRASGNVGGERAMLFVALMLADALDEARRRPAAEAEAALLDRIADTLESLANTLEDAPQRA